jgi:uncharacterized YigZ family protein
VSKPKPTDPDRFCTIAKEAEASNLISGSKFIAHLAPAMLPVAADQVLRSRQRKYPDASHHCWAYRVGRPDSLVERSSDAGEPNGTAGRPIADAFLGANLENIVCVVTRYFGGTKLGTGGLVRAYGDTARMAIAAATVIEKTIVREVSLTFDHERTGVVYRVLEEFGVHLEQGSYDTQAHGVVYVPAGQTDRLCDRLRELALDGIAIVPGELGIR